MKARSFLLVLIAGGWPFGFWSIAAVQPQVGQPYQISGEMVLFGDVGAFRISPDASRVVYRADQATDEVSELYSVPLAGGTPVRLNATLVAGGGCNWFSNQPRRQPRGLPGGPGDR